MVGGAGLAQIKYMETLGVLITIVILALASIFTFYFKCRKVQKCYHHIFIETRKPDAYSEVVIVGGGILGASLGAALSSDGHQVTIIERDLSEPDRIVGELLQPGGYKALIKLGLKDAVEGIDSHAVHGYVIHHQGSIVDLSYPRDENGDVITGRSFHHGRFVMGLRQQAKKKGAVLVQGTVTSLVQNMEGKIVGVCYKDKDSVSKYIQARLTVVADGCFSKFRKDFNPHSVKVSSQFVGAILHNCPQYKKGHAEIVLSLFGPILIYQISSKSTRILVDVRGQFPVDIATFMKENILPELPDHIKSPFEEAIKQKAFRSMPNSFLPATTEIKPGVLLLGDAFNMRHPLTGAGMTVALSDAWMWQQQLKQVKNLSEHSKIMTLQRQFLWKRKLSHSFVVNILAQALYALFSASDENLHYLRKACFSYFKLGGRAVSDPVGLLSMLRPNPFLLIGHFFGVALYAVYQIITGFKLYRLHYAMYTATAAFFKACCLILPLILSETKNLITF